MQREESNETPGDDEAGQAPEPWPGPCGIRARFDLNLPYKHKAKPDVSPTVDYAPDLRP